MKRFTFLNAVLLFVFAIGSSQAGPSGALGAAVYVNSASYAFEQTISGCTQLATGAIRNQCVGNAMDKLVKDITVADSDINIVAPPAAPALRSASSQVKSAKTKSAGATALNRVQSVVRDLAAKSSGQANLVYNRLNQAMAKAQSVIEAGG